MKLVERIPGPPLLWYSVILFGISGSILRVLADIGAQNQIDGRNAISFCNILFAGNALAASILYVIHRKDWVKEKLNLLTRKEWFSLTLVALLGNCFAPMLFFLAIEKTMVTSVVLISQIEAPILLLLAWLFLQDNVRPLSFIGSLIALLGVAVIILLQPDSENFVIGKGELFAATAAVIYAISVVMGRSWLKNIPIGIFSVFRTAVGTTFFFIIANYLFGPEHFVDLTSPFLWKWMIIYGGIIIVSGQYAWDAGLRKSNSTDVSLATSFSPIAGVLGALLILGELPLFAHYIGGSILMFGIFLGLIASIQINYQKNNVIKDSKLHHSKRIMEAECKTGFKGI